ncbi:MAG: protein kinase [Candidatus Saccharimonas sp.]|nr:protein kinase [Planctomycetaceae bacterium]
MSPLPPSVEALREIDLVCDRFEAEWLAGHKPRVEDFLADATACDREAWLSALLDVQRELICRDNAASPVATIPLTAPPATASSVATVRLRVTAGPHSGREFEFDRHETLLAGRSSFAQLRLDDDVHFSRNHFRLEVNPPECHLIDLDSTNGTFVNGKRVRQQHLKDGDVVLVGDTELTVTSIDPQATLLRVAPPPARPKRTGAATSPSRMPTVPGYEIESEIGWGDLGATYRATRLATGEPCALKLLTPADRMNDRTVQVFLREAGVLSQLHHPHIVRLLDLGSANGLLYIATEFVPAVRWDAVMEKATPETRIRIACGLICQVLDALEYAHTRSFVHRDIKPSNVLVRREGRRLVAKLSDFGLAKRYADAGLSQLTCDGDVLGSLPYMSPEQFIDSRHAKPTCDIYSAGATLYRLLTGHDPFVFAKGKCKFRTILEDEPIPLLKSFPQVPESLAKIVVRALAKDPSDRFSSAAEMRHALLPFGRRR